MGPCLGDGRSDPRRRPRGVRERAASLGRARARLVFFLERVPRSLRQRPARAIAPLSVHLIAGHKAGHLWSSVECREDWSASSRRRSMEYFLPRLSAHLTTARWSRQWRYAVGTFLVALALIASERLHRTKVALLGAAVVVLLVDGFSQEQAIEAVDFNTIGLLVGMMVLVYLTQQTGVYDYVAIRAGQLSRRPAARCNHRPRRHNRAALGIPSTTLDGCCDHREVPRTKSSTWTRYRSSSSR